MNILTTLRARFAEALADFTDSPATFAEMVKPAQDSRFGDYQANFAMPLAKHSGLNPKELASRVLEKTDLADLCTEAEVAGPGFINLTLRDEWIENRVNDAAADQRLGVDPLDPPKKVIVDFSSPNVAKPMHVGHLRSTVIGDALARTLRFLGHRVITDNHIGDWGTQFGMIIYGFKHFVDDDAYEADPVAELARLYRLVNQLCDYQDARARRPEVRERVATQSAELQRREHGGDIADRQVQKALKKQRSDLAAAHEELKSLEVKLASVDDDRRLKTLADQHSDIVRATREETARLHAKDAENRRLWQEFLPACLGALQRIYDRLDIQFDLTLGESWYDDRLANVVGELERRGLAEESDGASCVFIEGNDAPFIIRKADGAFTYATTDLATIRYRVDELHADTILYVVDARQSEHFKLLFATARKWGYDRVELAHVSFGTVMGPDGRPYKTRSGDTVGLESLLDEAVSRARKIVAANDDAQTDANGNPKPELTEHERDQIAEMVGIGGIKYADLRHNRESDYVFDYDKMLAKTGDTATYMQYAHARIHGIFRKGGILPDQLRAGGARIQLGEPAERALALKLCRYPETLAAVAADSRPNLLTAYLFELANELTAFYDQCPVLKAADAATRDSRLRLCDLAGRVIAHGLELLGIRAPQQM